MTYIKLFIAFFQIGLFSFGGGYASLPLIEQQIIHNYNWINQNTFNDLITISQMTPGPIAINASTFIGSEVAGMKGAIIATLGCVLPSCIIVSLLAYFYIKYKNIGLMKNILAYLRPAVVAMIAISGVSIGLSTFFENSIISLELIRYHAIVIFIVCLVLLKKYKMNPIVIMLFAGILEVGYQMI